MKLFMLSALALLLAFTPAAFGSARKTQTHITRNEAQHIALSDQPGGRVTAAHLDRSRGHAVWRIEIAEPQANRVTRLAVDATSGRVLSGRKTTR